MQTWTPLPPRPRSKKTDRFKITDLQGFEEIFPTDLNIPVSRGMIDFIIRIRERRLRSKNKGRMFYLVFSNVEALMVQAYIVTLISRLESVSQHDRKDWAFLLEKLNRHFSTSKKAKTDGMRLQAAMISRNPEDRDKFLAIGVNW